MKPILDRRSNMAKLIRSRAGSVRPWAKFRFALLYIAQRGSLQDP